MRKRNHVLSVPAAASAVAVLISACAPPAALADSNLTLQCVETLVPNASAVVLKGTIS